MAEAGMEKHILPWATVMELMDKDLNLHKKWSELYSFKEEIKRLRLRCHEFLAEDNYWNQALNAYAEKSWQTDGHTSERLYQLLIKSYLEKQNNTADGIIISGDLTALQEKYEGKHSDLIIDLLVCLDGERQLLLVNQVEDMDTMEKDGVVHNVQQLDALHKELDNYVKRYEFNRDSLEELRRRLESLYPSDLLHMPPNGVNVPITVIQDQIRECEAEKRNISKKISGTMNSIVDHANTVLTELKSEMERWREEQKMFYVDVAKQPSMPAKPPLTKWCAHAGQTLFDLIRCSLPNIPVDNDQILAQKMQEIYQIFEEMQQCCFVVTDQEKKCIKVSMGTKKKSSDGQEEDDEDSGGNKKFSCPKFKATVRLFAAASIDSVEPVRAYFVHEESLAQVRDPANYDFSKSKYPLKDTKTKGSSSSATVEKGTGTATFKTLELKSFNREKEGVVAKEKFRIMFQTKLKVGDRDIKLWAMSLPIVVITGASQQCNACGSLLWQCLNPADEGQFPPPPCPENLPWSQVKELLDTKLQYLGGRGLSLEEEKHLVYRITGKTANIEEDPEIPFKKFCIDKMMDISDPNKKADDRKKSATFWMWFQAVYNLINNHLKEYWKQELIIGFLSKAQAEKCLEGFKANTFLLRFSNNIITDAQGQNMCGAISVSYLQAGGNVDHMTPSNAENLKKHNLAKTLERMINGKSGECEMKWVYPSMKSREEVYKDFLDVDRSLRKPTDGYTILKEMLVIDPVEELTDGVGMLTTEGRPKKRPVHRFKGHTGNRSDSKVAKVIGQPIQCQEQMEDGILGEMGSGQQSGNIPTVLYEREPNIQHTTSLISVPVQGSATSNRAFSAPAASDVSTNQSFLLNRSKSLSQANKHPNLQTILSAPVKVGLKSKLSHAAHYPQGSVEVNKDIGLSCAEDRLDMVHRPQKTITGGNDGFSKVESKVKPCNSPASSSSVVLGGLKQSGSPQSQGFMDPKIEAQSPPQNVQQTTQMIEEPLHNQILLSLPNTTQITGSPALASHQMLPVTSQLQPAGPVITEPTVGQLGQVPMQFSESAPQHEQSMTDLSEDTSQRNQLETTYPDLDLGILDLLDESSDIFNPSTWIFDDIQFQNAN